MSWPEHLVLDSKETADVDPSDGECRLTYMTTCFADNRIKICKEKQFCEHLLLNVMDVVDIPRSYKIALGCIPQARKLLPSTTFLSRDRETIMLKWSSLMNTWNV